ncbi:MAG: hypothetical protein Q4A64_03355 [Porphyromonadaceae bacterium]|nr:hypothetical protein [Porphyromonadaceae bacterium]
MKLSGEPLTLDTSLDTVTIVKCLEQMVGGKVLETKGFSPEVIKAGHVIIRDQQNGKEYKPMPVASNGKDYDSLPSNHDVVGVAYCSVLTSRPLVPIMVRGSVNKVTSPYPITSELEGKLPLIRFTQD